MFVPGLLTFIALKALSAHAKVVMSFDDCKRFFCEGIEPQGMDQNAKKICQMLENHFYFATLYSDFYKIPLYSAYTLDSKCLLATERKDIWHVEPQISDPSSSTGHMVREKISDINTIKRNQAVSSDYTDSGYDRGHLNPSSFQSGEGRTGTFTLTNAAPMDAHFNRIYWRKWESTLRRFLLSKLNSDGESATAYIVTGTVPSANLRIPQSGNPVDSDRVTVPSYIWTAVSYISENNPSNSFSFGYIGKNQQAEHGISLMSVSDLEIRLSELYSELSKTQRLVKIFNAFCNKDNDHEDEVKRAFEKLMNPPKKDAMNSAPKKTSNTSESDSNYNNKTIMILLALLTICIVSKWLYKTNQNQEREVLETCLDDHPCTTNDYNRSQTGHVYITNDFNRPLPLRNEAKNCRREIHICHCSKRKELSKI